MRDGQAEGLKSNVQSRRARGLLERQFWHGFVNARHVSVADRNTLALDPRRHFSDL